MGRRYSRRLADWHHVLDGNPVPVFVGLLIWPVSLADGRLSGRSRGAGCDRLGFDRGVPET